MPSHHRAQCRGATEVGNREAVQSLNLSESPVQTLGWNRQEKTALPYSAQGLVVLPRNLGKRENISLSTRRAHQPRWGYLELCFWNQWYNSERMNQGCPGQEWRLGSDPKARSCFHPFPGLDCPQAQLIPCLPPAYPLTLFHLPLPSRSSCASLSRPASGSGRQNTEASTCPCVSKMAKTRFTACLWPDWAGRRDLYQPGGWGVDYAVRKFLDLKVRQRSFIRSL